mmetsp:Transcript_2601/g.4571  ORF Transcript_2601/g.4571 Transcript_2601/m.4571 type:complete len:127 (-) Transcript_2601:1180-1560(-)
MTTHVCEIDREQGHVQVEHHHELHRVWVRAVGQKNSLRMHCEIDPGVRPCEAKAVMNLVPRRKEFFRSFPRNNSSSNNALLLIINTTVFLFFKHTVNIMQYLLSSLQRFKLKNHTTLIDLCFCHFD